MPRIQTIICSGVCLLITSFTTAQLSPPGKNATIQQVVSYQIYQQKQWNANQIPKNSVLYQYNARDISQPYLQAKLNYSLPSLNISVKLPEANESLSEKIRANMENIKYYPVGINFSCWGRGPILKQKTTNLFPSFLKRD